MSKHRRTKRVTARPRAVAAALFAGGEGTTLGRQTARAVEGVVEQLHREGQMSGPFEIVVRIQHEGAVAVMPHSTPAVLPSTSAASIADVTPVPAALAHPLALRPVLAPTTLLEKRPFRRHIEGSRPYIVLGEGLQMINAHPVALMVFWGGLTSWTLGAILAGHHVASAVRLAMLLMLLLGCLTACLARIGKLAEARDSVQALRAALAEPATWVGIERSGRMAQVRHCLAWTTGRLLLVPAPEQTLLRDTDAAAVGNATRPPRTGLTTEPATLSASAGLSPTKTEAM